MLNNWIALYDYFHCPFRVLDVVDNDELIQYNIHALQQSEKKVSDRESFCRSLHVRVILRQILIQKKYLFS